MKQLTGIWPVLALVAILLTAITLLSNATEDSARFGQLYSALLLVNAVGLIALAALLGWNLVRLIGQLKRRETGARLTLRMTGLFVLLALTPVLVVYFFSLQTLHRGIESWFDVRIDNAFDDALELSQTSLEIRMREHLRRTQAIADQLATIEGDSLALLLGDALSASGAVELTVVDERGQIVASGSADLSKLVPTPLDAALLLRVSQARSYVDLDPIDGGGLNVRAVAELAGDTPGRRYLHGLFPVAEKMGDLAASVQSGYAKYRELAYLREGLKFSFTLTLSLVLLLSIFAAAWAAFYSARRIVAPLRGLADATQAIAEGDYERRVAPTGDDELGFLVSSFNDMTAKLRRARDETSHSQAQVEAQRGRLQAVLERMSSGVITIDEEHRVATANPAAAQILQVEEADQLRDMGLADIAQQLPRLSPLAEALSAHLTGSDADWRAEVNLFGVKGRQVLVCRGTTLLGQGGGHVVVFDDLTALIQAERNAAWSEVARRLAHEIKNPLTPIQLSAERLRHKYLPRMDKEEASLLDRLTRTIVNQVESMEEMVNAFSSYARSPQSEPRPVALNPIVSDVVNLYSPRQVVMQLDAALPTVEADPDRLRQLLHNLLKNALEACSDNSEDAVMVTTTTGSGYPSMVELTVCDQGRGIEEHLLPTLFDPYVTNKTRGTGLGLAIVKKKAEENSGDISATNNEGGVGATFTLRLPVSAAETSDPETSKRGTNNPEPPARKQASS
ncbi:MAG: HAMP domain-containing protein [Chromatiales bacterium]|nr:HAMP domain-containing protein [Chromatiales bacterium]